MSKQKNLFYQFQTALKECDHTGESKRDVKLNDGLGGEQIYSYSEFKNLTQTAHEFSQFVKENYPYIKMVRDITPEHAVAFLNSKLHTCRPTTIKQYASRLEKLSICVNYRFACNTSYHTVVNTKGKIGKVRSIATVKEDYDKMIRTFKTDCVSKRAIMLARHTGLRVDALSRIKAGWFNPQDRTLTVYHDKGGKTYTKHLNDQAYELLKQYTKYKKDNQYIFPNRSHKGHIQADSINKTLKEHYIKAGITDYKDHKTGIHAIRKLYAQELLEECLQKGMSQQKAENYVSHELGHGNNRRDVIQTYTKASKPR